jgi:hypothetical protein
MAPQREPTGHRQAGRRGGHRVHTGELISTTSALLLAPSMFLLDWYGRVGEPRVRRSGITTAETAWQALTLLRWVMLLTILLAVGATVVHATQRGHGARTETGLPVALAGTLTAVLVGYRVLIDPPDPSSVVDVKLGAFLGLLAAVAIAVGGYESLREERELRERRVGLVRTGGRRGLASGPTER